MLIKFQRIREVELKKTTEITYRNLPFKTDCDYGRKDTRLERILPTLVPGL